MYLIGTEVTITWDLLPATLSPLLSDFDLVLHRPNKQATYLPNVIPIGNYTPPTEFENGKILYKITPDTPGLWTLELVVGTQSNYQILGSCDLFVFNSIVSTPAARVRIVSIPIEWQLVNWDNDVGEQTLWKYQTETETWTATSETTSIGHFIPVNGWNTGYRESSVPVDIISLGSEIPNDLTLVTITDDDDTVIGELEVLPSTTPTGYDIDLEIPLDFTDASDIEHLQVSGNKTYYYVFEDTLEGFILTSRPYSVESAESLDSDFSIIEESPTVTNSELMSSNFVTLTGQIRSALKFYDSQEPESIDSSFSSILGTLYDAAIGNNAAGDSIDSSMASITGSLTDSLVTYSRYDHESIDSGFSSITGSLV